MDEVAVSREGGRSSSGTVGRALRILMTRYDVGVEDAFELLVRGARRARLDLRDVATGIVHASQRRLGGGPRGCRPVRSVRSSSRPTPRSPTPRS